MQEKLVVLRELQSLDQQLIKLDEKRRQLESAISGQRLEMARVQEMVDGLADEMEGFQTRRRELNDAIAQEERNIERSDARLPDIKTQKEYVAVLKEIDTAKAMIRDLQAQLAEVDRQLESLGSDRAEKEQELASLAATVEARQAEVDQEMAGFSSSVAEMNGRKESLLERIPAGVRKRYQTLISRRGGMAVVEARNGACTGCNMQLPPQLYNSLFKLDKPQYCPHCNRLIYVQTEQG
ncbi:zinc ribbon domain-containing protein [Geothermobacter hydrogeniphilus]|uniref:zinc ribbon domain-containing protein n=1 Tax=Geothermobacter hydrogeniphilus TaxID=1969733 RepID=UPI0011AEC849|nr:C4-type zinc ribbon domain-containing protein [Geothermobacter hydrogeniphilus]